MISRALLNAPFFILKDADLLRNRKVNTKKRQNRHLPELAFLILGTYFTAPFLSDIIHSWQSVLHTIAGKKPMHGKHPEFRCF